MKPLNSGKPLPVSEIFGYICITALVVQIIFILLISSVLPSEQVLSVDASSYHTLAQNLVECEIFTCPLDPPYNPALPGTFRPPLTPLFLAAMYAFLGVNIVWGRLGLAVVSAFSCGLTYIIGECLFGRWVGLRPN